ncbi:MAG: hypothetical protein COY69_02460 [Candidatus Magasanikbacteria bacterium CG_4_10_14_0_8_um_filter_32_14]|uniref:50S ribosomal protein L7/L12 n=1 Tax=Candidatus Magasanikbacteria bacterium CG_4_10_14_0_8_um_filter_32_14 TaxID=1974640 RepID=A0A2M7R955_9BACT|nr:MAG: hypothetical protein COY69_02460 [Candidatus Magasanikbacteria bacterium CG_4_10_14_0_8_um_filter_32_14]
MTDLFDDDSITKINQLTPSLSTILQEKELTNNKTNIDTEKIKFSLFNLKNQIDQILALLEGKTNESIFIEKTKIVNVSSITDKNEQNILEGVFDGEKMFDGDGKEYVVPPNYASKSKLVEGDIMKLTITNNGKFIYKQIGPIARKRIIGILEFDEDKQLWNVAYQGKKYKVLTASVTFYRGKPYDETVALIPQDSESNWCAMENVISK